MNIEMKNHLFYQIVIYYQNWKYQEKEDYLQKYNFDNFIQVCMDGFMYGYHKIHSILNWYPKHCITSEKGNVGIELKLYLKYMTCISSLETTEYVSP